jgi:hypothetical protein
MNLESTMKIASTYTFRGRWRLVLFLSDLIICLGLLSCVQKTTNLPIDSDLKAAFDFLPGTYWIYKDALSGRLDSFYVTSNVFAPAIHLNSEQTEDAIGYIVKEVNKLNYADSGIYMFSLRTNIMILDYYYLIFGIHYDYYTLLNYPFVINQYSLCAQIYPDFTIGNVNFSNVGEFTPSPNGYFDTIYVCPDIGIVKMSLNHPQDSIQRKIWELQRWNIVK